MTHPLTTSALSFDEYQQLTAVTAIYPEAGSGSAGALAYVTLGLVGEAGEVGDVTWYLARLATELQVSLGDVGQKNLDKLLDRKDRGVLQGSGDTR
jgi:hypothetical protein